MLAYLIKFLKEEDGPTAVEYAVMLALIVIASIGAITSFGVATRDSLQGSSDDIINAIGP